MFRSQLARLTVALLSVHVLVMSGTTLVATSWANAGSEIVCTCAHGADHGSCPMHRTTADSARCRLQSTQDDLGTALMSVLALLALPVISGVAAIDAPTLGPIGYSAALPFDRIVPPEPPPPRR